MKKSAKQNTKFKTVILLSKPRSGSNLLGQILSFGSNNFYTVEPIYFLLNKALHTGIDYPIDKKTILKDVVSCSFKKYYADFRPLSIKTFTPMTRDTCLSFPNFCDETETEAADIEEKFCKISDLHVVKTVKASFNDTVAIFSDTINSAFKSTALIHLVRDPRAILSSREILLKAWNRHDNNVFNVFLDSNTPREICNHVKQDLKIAQQYWNIFKNRWVHNINFYNVIN